MDSNNNLFDLQIDTQVSEHLSDSAKWAKFLAIAGFISCGLFVLVGIFLALNTSRFGTALGGDSIIANNFLAYFYIIGALLYFFPCLYLFRFAVKMQIALRSNDQIQLTDSFKNLKSSYKFIGILTIIILSMYVLALVFGILAAVMNG